MIYSFNHRNVHQPELACCAWRRVYRVIAWIVASKWILRRVYYTCMCACVCVCVERVDMNGGIETDRQGESGAQQNGNGPRIKWSTLWRRADARAALRIGLCSQWSWNDRYTKQSAPAGAHFYTFQSEGQFNCGGRPIRPSAIFSASNRPPETVNVCARAPPNDIYIYIDTVLEWVLEQWPTLKCICGAGLTTNFKFFPSRSRYPTDLGYAAWPRDYVIALPSSSNCSLSAGYQSGYPFFPSLCGDTSTREINVGIGTLRLARGREEGGNMREDLLKKVFRHGWNIVDF